MVNVFNAPNQLCRRAGTGECAELAAARGRYLSRWAGMPLPYDRHSEQFRLAGRAEKMINMSEEEQRPV